VGLVPQQIVEGLNEGAEDSEEDDFVFVRGASHEEDQVANCFVHDGNIVEEEDVRCIALCAQKLRGTSYITN
jgi:hypothetical protein